MLGHRRSDPSRSGLDGVAVGTKARISAVELTGRSRLRLAELGLRTGDVVTVLGRTTGGGRLVAVGNSRIALDARTACALGTEPM